jgi:hypothetical protein
MKLPANFAGDVTAQSHEYLRKYLALSSTCSFMKLDTIFVVL